MTIVTLIAQTDQATEKFVGIQSETVEGIAHSLIIP